MNIQDIVKSLNAINQFFQLRNAIKILAIIISVTTYHLIFEYKAPAENFLTIFFSRPAKISFLSGAPGGFYIRIGKYLEKNTSDKPNGFRLNAKSTNGALDNLNRILTQANSMGLINEITSPPKDFSRSQINYITPLYMERLHIFYRKSSLRKILSEFRNEINLSNFTPTLKIEPDRYTKKFLNQAIINGGPHGSGTRLLTSYFVNTIKGYKQKDLLVYNNKKAEGFFERKKSYDIHFSVVGDPLPWFDRLSRDSAYGMISIDPALMAKVNSIYDLNLRFADFKDKYSSNSVNQITTVGSYVNLVASKDINTSVIINVLNLLRKATPRDLEVGNSMKFQLHEVDYASNIKKLEKEKTTLLQSFLFFLLSVSITSIILIWIFVTLVSKSKISKYYRSITEIYQNHLFFKPSLTERDNKIIVPHIPQNSIDRISSLSTGFQKILNVIDKAFSEYKKGGIVETDYKNLLSEFHTLIDDFHIGLYRRIYCAIDEGIFTNQSYLNEFFNAGFLTKEGFESLTETLNNKKPSSPAY